MPSEIVELNSETAHSGQQGRCNHISQRSVNEDSFLAQLVCNEKPLTFNFHKARIKAVFNLSIYLI